MYYEFIDNINRQIKKNKKAIISLGCSFVEAQGAIDQELYDRLGWDMLETGKPMVPKLNKKEFAKLLFSYKDVSYDVSSNIWDFTKMEYKNSFVHVLCNNFLEGKYTPINLGLRGRGNRASIRSLYLWPQIRWDLLEEIIVIYCPSGQERFDFINDKFDSNGQYVGIWPHYNDIKEEGPRKDLWKGYGEGIYSTKTAVLEQITNFVEIQNWCKLHNAKLIVTPAFESYNEHAFFNELNQTIIRDHTQKRIKKLMIKGEPKEKINHYKKLIEQVEWKNFFKPQDCETFIELCLKQENLQHRHFWQFNGIGTPDRWVTKCAHPSAKAHKLFAKELHKHIFKITNV
jgi:hypothetical protein